MKKSILIALTALITISLLAGGCSKKNTTNIPIKNTLAEYKYETTINCPALKNDIKYSSGNWFVTKDNDIYVYSIDGIYTNNTNCMKLEEKFDDIALVDYPDGLISDSSLAGTIIECDNFTPGYEMYINKRGELVYVYATGLRIEREVCRNRYNNSIHSLQLLLEQFEQMGYSRIRLVGGEFPYKEPIEFYLITKDGDEYPLKTSGYHYVYATKNDNNIYFIKYRLTRFELNEPTDREIKILSEEVVYSIPKDEKIIDFYYSGYVPCNYFNDDYYSDEDYNNMCITGTEAWKKYIISDKAYYRPLLQNTECEKYLDIPCEYEWQRDDDISSIINNYVYIDNYMILTKDGKVYKNNIPGLEYN